MSAKAESNGGLVTGGAATLALAAAGWFALGLVTTPTEPPLIDVSGIRTLAAPAAGEPGWSTPDAWRGDRTLPTLHPEARPAVVAQGAPVVFLAHGADHGSGVASQACHTGRHPGFSRLGVHTVTCTVRDRAGNIAVALTTYRVVSKVG